MRRSVGGNRSLFNKIDQIRKSDKKFMYRSGLTIPKDNKVFGFGGSVELTNNVDNDNEPIISDPISISVGNGLNDWMGPIELGGFLDRSVNIVGIFSDMMISTRNNTISALQELRLKTPNVNKFKATKGQILMLDHRKSGKVEYVDYTKEICITLCEADKEIFLNTSNKFITIPSSLDNYKLDSLLISVYQINGGTFEFGTLINGTSIKETLYPSGASFQEVSINNTVKLGDKINFTLNVLEDNMPTGLNVVLTFKNQ